VNNREVKTKKLGIGGHLAALLLGGGIFAACFWLLKIGLVWCIVLGVVGYLITAGQLFSRKIKKGSRIELTGIDKKKLADTLEEGRLRLREMRSYTSKIRDYRVRKKANGVYQAASDIFENFKDDPRDIKKARQFLNYYFDSAITILKKYIELKDKKIKIDSPELEETLSKVESTLDTVKTAFEKQLAKLQENDVMDLDIEIEVLKKTLQAEGLGTD
jgi:5-bromo-4-chloroindolyl phosphate hydrolysis protein